MRAFRNIDPDSFGSRSFRGREGYNPRSALELRSDFVNPLPSLVGKPSISLGKSRVFSAKHFSRGKISPPSDVFPISFKFKSRRMFISVKKVPDEMRREEIRILLGRWSRWDLAQAAESDAETQRVYYIFLRFCICVFCSKTRKRKAEKIFFGSNSKIIERARLQNLSDATRRNC